MLEFACHAAKTHFALVSANLELNAVRICIGMLKNGCKGPQHALSRPGRKHLVAPSSNHFSKARWVWSEASGARFGFGDWGQGQHAAKLKQV